MLLFITQSKNFDVKKPRRQENVRVVSVGEVLGCAVVRWLYSVPFVLNSEPELLHVLRPAVILDDAF